MTQFVPQQLPDVMLACVPPTLVRETWPLVETMIIAAYERNGLVLPANTENRLVDGSLLLWLAIDADMKILCATILALVDGSDGMVCEIRACGGGQLRAWLPFHHELERFAVAEGCVRMRLRGRRGWLRVLSGYSAVGECIEKELFS